MEAEHREMLLLDEHHECSSIEIMHLSGLSQAELSELVECGALTPVDQATTPWIFRANCIVTARTASRLRNDLELDFHAVALVLKLLERISQLEMQLQDTNAKHTRWSGK